MEQLQRFYAGLSKKSYLTLAISLLVATDVVVLGFIYFKFSNHEFFEKVMQMSLQLNGLSVESMGDEFITALYSLFQRSLVISIGLAFVYHLINYYFWSKEKKFALMYVKLLCGAGGPIIAFWGLSLLFSGSFIGAVLFLLGVADFTLSFGLNKFEDEPVKRPTKVGLK